MMLRLTTLRSITQYSLACLRVLCSTRTLWSTLIISSILVLAVIGTSAAWRARTSGEEPLPADATLAVSPLTELAPQTTPTPAPYAATTSTSPTPILPPAATETQPITQSDEARTSRANATMRTEHTQPVPNEHVCATPHEVTMLERQRMMTERRNAVARVTQDPDARGHPSRPVPRAPAPPLPRVQVVGVSSTAVLIQHERWRQIVRRGARLNGWTLVRLAPSGVTLQRRRQQALLPLTFGPRDGGTR